jgi:hypothetical protein
MRSIHNRVRNLESAVRPSDYCGVCGAPGQLRFYVVTETTDPLPRCSDCGRVLDPDGAPLGNHYKRLIMPGGNPIRDAAPAD